eukprot:Sdes_comp15879_c0_seq1m4982
MVAKHRLSQGGGDDLDDGLLYDLQSGEDSDSAEFVDSPTQNTPPVVPHPSDPTSESTTNKPKSSRKIRRKEKFRGLDEEFEMQFRKGNQDTIYSVFSKLYSNFLEKHGKLSDIEIEQKYFPKESFLELTTVSDPRDINGLSSLAKTLLGQLPDVSTSSFGAPLLIILTGSSVKAAEILKQLKSLGLSQVAKLFSRHLKPLQQIEHLKTHHINIAVGTPGRVHKLLTESALLLTHLSFVVVDCMRDVKQKNFFQYPETCDDFFALFDQHFLPSLQQTTPPPNQTPSQ